MAEGEVTLYRGILVRRGTPVNGMLDNQMASTDPGSALRYGINPPGYGNRSAPADAEELVLMRFNATPDQLYIPPTYPRGGPGEPLEHVFVRDGVDITQLPGYEEIRVPVSEVSTPREGGGRVVNEEAAQALAARLRSPEPLCASCPRPPQRPTPPRPGVRATPRVMGILGILGLPSMFLDFYRFMNDPVYRFERLNPGVPYQIRPDGSVVPDLWA